MSISSTRVLLERLKMEIQKYPNTLIEFFPDRIKRFSDNNLSTLWRGCNERYVSICKVKAKKFGFKVSDKELDILKKNLITKFNNKAGILIKIIEDYRSDKISMNTFISKLRYEIVRISSDFPITWKELSLLLTGKDSIEFLLTHQLNPNSQRFDKDFKFSRERLKYFRDSLRDIFGGDSRILVQLINKYEELNPDLKDYSHQRYTIKNPDLFSSINTVESAYWFGFLCADGHINKYNNIRFELSIKDKDMVFKFAKFVGLEKTRIKFINRLNAFFSNKLWIKSVQVIFTCKPMAEDLRKNGYFNSRNFESLPYFVLNSINIAKLKSKKEFSYWINEKDATIALSWLLGFYDGDGNHGGGQKAVLYSSNKDLLNQIKLKFDIPNKIGLLKGQSMYRVNIGSKLFKAMMISYKKSLERKRQQ